MLTQRVLRKRTKEVEVLDELVLGASLVGGTKDVNEQTTGQEAGEDAIRVDLRLAQAASGRATTTLGLGRWMDGGPPAETPRAKAKMAP